MIKKPCLGVCYFPEQRDESLWQDDINRMVGIGLSKVRLAEFSWAVIEPRAGEFDWGWLDKSIDLIGSAGLEVILSTPTATPPKWLIDQHPEILAVDEQGRTRGFGSRRHYCFSSPIYREKMSAITHAFAKRYGNNPYVTAWQTDNEYGCHNTTRSYSRAAKTAFRHWLKAKYREVEVLNNAWGNIFWSMLYSAFDEIELPNLTVTEPNPSHVLDFYRFSSDQVIAYNKLQVDILRKRAPGRDIIHNFMGFYHAFDHFKLGQDLDVASWDSYPTGFLNMFAFTDEEKARYFRQGHPDIAAFHHDLYRGCSNGRWAVMEQQPGPVNWANQNAVPLTGMVRLWSHEALAHGAEFVSYFRWDQAKYAQEQMHAGLVRPDNAPSPAYGEAEQTATEMAMLPEAKNRKAPIALMFSYDALWLFEAHPQGANWSYPDLCFRWYSQLRQLGQNIDIVAPGSDLTDYKLVIVPSLPYLDAKTFETLKSTDAQILMGPRTGSKTKDLQIPKNLAPGLVQELVPLKIVQSESLPDLVTESVIYKNNSVQAGIWLDYIETALEPMAITASGQGVLYRQDNYALLATVPDQAFLKAIFSDFLAVAGLKVLDLPSDLRVRRHGDLSYIFNYGPAPLPAPERVNEMTGTIVVGGESVDAAGVQISLRPN